jgi:hypothetical protein
MIAQLGGKRPKIEGWRRAADASGWSLSPPEKACISSSIDRIRLCANARWYTKVDTHGV